MGLYVLSRLLFICVQFDIQAASGALCTVTSVVCLCSLTSRQRTGLYVLSRLLFVCVQFDIQVASGALRAVTSVVCLCTG